MFKGGQTCFLFATSTVGFFRTFSSCTTPRMFTSDQKIPYLPFTEEEYLEVVRGFTDLTAIELSPSIITFIADLCEGHPGLTRACLTRIEKDFKLGENGVTADNFNQLVMLSISNGSLSEKLLSDARCFIKPDDIAKYLDIKVEYVYKLIGMMLLRNIKYGGIFHN